MSWKALALAVILASGCLGAGGQPSSDTATRTPTATEAPSSAAPASSSGPSSPARFSANVSTVRSFHHVYNLTLTSAYAVVERSNFDGNCLRIGSEATGIHGTAAATWTAQAPLTESLQIDIANDDSNDQARGASPLRLSIENQAAKGERFSGPFLAVQMSGPGVAANQSVSLALDLVYESDKDLVVEDAWSCSWS